jgi:hypothetical protein
MLEWLLLFAAYLCAGFTLKLGDDLLDEIKRPNMAILPLGLAGLIFGLLMSNSEWDLVLLTAIVIGVVLSGKVNKPQFLVGFLLIGLVLVLNGLPIVSDFFVWLAVLVVLLFTAIIDEIQNDRADRNPRAFASKFFLYRFTMKLSVLVLAIPLPEFLPAAVGLWMFDLGYEAARALVYRIKS